MDENPEPMDPEWRRHARTDAWLDPKQARKRRTGSRRRWWGFAAFLVILAVTTTLVVLAGRRSAHDALPPDPTWVPAIAPVDLAHPFAHTPADTWRTGLDGITSPAAADIGSFKADAVAAAYAKVRQVIAAARLDPAVLYRHDPQAFLALFALDARPAISEALARKPSKDGRADVSSYLTRIADGHRLLGQGPRSSGTLTARPGEGPNQLVVDAQFAIAYAFGTAHPEQLSGPRDIVTFLRVDESYLVRRDTGMFYSNGLWPFHGESALSSAGCAAAEDGFLAPGYTNPETDGPGLGDRDAPGYYDPKYPVPALDGCPAR
ncbi:hypothetical protein [Amycolatopsis sp. NPDC004625]|uniref:hypothetical protein n=1 Tax=Amycolatopsis sp. NPDC004625 TaxID=3154670 RepID=UPI0033B5FC35